MSAGGMKRRMADSFGAVSNCQSADTGGNGNPPARRG
jgi:hypothetical protein